MAVTQCFTNVGPTQPAASSMCTSSGGSLMLFMMLVDRLINRQSDIDDARNRPNRRFRETPESKYDFIVIGSGCAGSVAAERLSSEKRWKVLLIERGDNEPVAARVPSLSFIGSDIDYKYKTEPSTTGCLSSGGVCSWPRGKVLGGTSVINGMMHTRGNPSDYDNWEKLGNKGWSFESVLPYFKSLEDNGNLDDPLIDDAYHAKGGLWPTQFFNWNPPMSQDILNAGEQLGYAHTDVNGRNITGFMIAQMNTKNGQRYSAGRAFLGAARDRKNLHIMVNSTATKIVIDPKDKRVSGVEIIDSKGNKHVVGVRKEVIVSGGAINSPQILLLSGIGPKEELEEVGVPVVHDLPGVGKNLQNHAAFTLAFTINEPDTAILNKEVLSEYVETRGGPLSGTGLSDVTAKIASPYAESEDQPDMQFFFNGYRATCSQTGAVSELNSENPRTITINPVVLSPKSTGYIGLKSADPLADPKMVYDYLSDDHDVKVLIWGIKFILKLVEQPALKKYNFTLDTTPTKGCESLSFGSDDYWECALRQNTGPENHQASSLKMGPASDPLAVVDELLQVRGLKGIRVMDTSIMPVLIRGNTCAPAGMIAAKGTDAIIKKYNEKKQSRNWRLK